MKLITQTFLGGENPTLSRPYHFKFSKGCLPQILLVPFLNTLSNLTLIAFSPFQFHFSFLQPLQTQRFSDVSRGHWKRSLAWNESSFIASGDQCRRFCTLAWFNPYFLEWSYALSTTTAPCRNVLSVFHGFYMWTVIHR